MGRHHEYDDLKAQRVYNALRKGASRRGAAQCAGIWPSTLFDWIARGKQGEKPFDAFAERILQIDGECEVDASQALFAKAVAGDWQAAITWLRTRRPKSWPTLAPKGRKGEEKADATKATDEELLAAVQGELQRRARKASHG